jgi:hypothetical protein
MLSDLALKVYDAPGRRKYRLRYVSTKRPNLPLMSIASIIGSGGLEVSPKQLGPATSSDTKAIE